MLRKENDLPPYWVLSAAGILFLIALIAYIDFWITNRITFSFLYLIPVVIATGRFGFRAGILTAFLTVATSLTMDLATHTYSWKGTPYVDALLHSITYVFMILIQKGYQHESMAARTDSLTGLLNRRAFWELMAAEVERCKRYHRPISIAYLDVDDFKAINDRYGHNTGDRFLKTLAKTLVKGARTTDKVAREGGDEFAILMIETDENGAKTALSRLCQLTQIMNQHLFSITVSVGVATFIKPPITVEAMISEADRLMYLCKQKGKNGIETNVIR